MVSVDRNGNAQADARATPPAERGDSRTLRGRIRAWLELSVVRNTILGIIIFNAVTLGLSTSDTIQAEIGGFLRIVDRVVLTIFVFEIALKFFAFGLVGFFRNPWNIFDL